MKTKVREFNSLCQRCLNKCKQTKEIKLLGCPDYEKKPQQLQFNFSYRKKKKNIQ